MSTGIDLVRPKIERANAHIRELHGALRAFIDTKPYVVGTKNDPQTRRLIYYIVSAAPVPVEIALIAGDVLQNLRSALDHLAYQLFMVGTKGASDPRHVYFPIADDATKYAADSPGKVKGMRQDAIDAINAVKPYRGGNDPLWRLHKLSNIDKHRLLITVGAAFKHINIGPRLMADLPKFAKTQGSPEWPAIDLYLTPEDKLFPLEAGKELFVDLPDAKVNEKMGFGFEIALREPGVIDDGEAIMKTLQSMVAVVDKLVSDFASLL